MKRYYFITDASLSKAGNAGDIRSALRAGVKVIQYRNKTGTTLEMFREAWQLRKLCVRATFIINDRVDIALAVDADGLHIGSHDLPYGIARKILGTKKIIGVTVHTLKEALQAQKQGADYIGLAPIFATSTKPDALQPVGTELIRAVKKRVRIPIIAIGGITLQNAPEVIAAGTDGLCAISAVVTKQSARREILKFQRLF